MNKSILRLIIDNVGIVFAWVVGYLGGFDLPLEILIVFVVADYLTGVISAFVNKTASSAIGAKGIVKKIALFLVVAIAHQVDVLLNLGDIMRTVAIGFYIANEGLSLLENLTKIGVPFPERLKDTLLQLKDKNKKKQEGDESDHEDIS